MNKYGLRAGDEKMENKKPEAKIRSGQVSATIWKNIGTSKEGKEFTNYSVLIVRSFTDKDGKWQDTNSFRLNELADVVDVATQARRWIREHPIKRDADED